MTNPALPKRRGLMLVLSSPSGAGKTTISRRLLAEDGNLSMSVSITTRKPRPGEKPGIDYHFIDEATYHQMVRDHALLEHAQVFDHYYGTPRKAVEAALTAGKDVLFDVDWQGTQQLREAARTDLAAIFILPPSLAELERRLKTRAQDSDEVVRKRMSKAASEMSHFMEYDYVVINVDVEESVARVKAILAAERSRRERYPELGAFVRGMAG